jgi:hypothetical protein
VYIVVSASPNKVLLAALIFAEIGANIVVGIYFTSNILLYMFSLVLPFTFTAWCITTGSRF